MDIPAILLKNPDDFISKPWNDPNQKISDYFNYSKINFLLINFNFITIQILEKTHGKNI